jgi:hypothetical protein
MMVVVSPVFLVLDIHRSRHLRTTALCVTVTHHILTNQAPRRPRRLRWPRRVGSLTSARPYHSTRRSPTPRTTPALFVRSPRPRPPPRLPPALALSTAPAARARPPCPSGPPLAFRARCRWWPEHQGSGATHNCVEVHILTVGMSAGDVKVRAPSLRVRAGADVSACRRRSGAPRRGCSRAAQSRRSCA